MRPSEQITIKVKSDDNSDFGKANPKWEPLSENVFAVIAGSRGKAPKTGRFVRSGDQMVAVADEDITIQYEGNEQIHREWQKKRPLQITDSLGDIYGVKSVAVLKGRTWQLKMGVVRN